MPLVNTSIAFCVLMLSHTKGNVNNSKQKGMQHEHKYILSITINGIFTLSVTAKMVIKGFFGCFFL